MAKHAHREQVFGSFFIDFVIILGPRDIFRFQWKIWEDNLGKCFWQNVRIRDSEIFLSLYHFKGVLGTPTPVWDFRDSGNLETQTDHQILEGYPIFWTPLLFWVTRVDPPKSPKPPKCQKTLLNQPLCHKWRRFFGNWIECFFVFFHKKPKKRHFLTIFGSFRKNAQNALYFDFLTSIAAGKIGVFGHFLTIFWSFLGFPDTFSGFSEKLEKPRNFSGKFFPGVRKISAKGNLFRVNNFVRLS